jgi:endonuclease YncB( thermonuclease family)
MMRRVALNICITTVLIAGTARAQTFEGHATAKDGDDLVIGGTDLRLFGIDAFELHQTCEADGKSYACGQLAKDDLAKKVLGHTVHCVQRDYDAEHHRPVAVCSIDGEDLNASMVSDGWALAYRKFSNDYVDEENRAKAEQKGAWGGNFIPAWKWRQGTRLTSESKGQPLVQSPAGCIIKGNVTKKGERIYHLPGQENYDDIVITPSKGEHWFCSEEEAVNAGWRKAKR